MPVNLKSITPEQSLLETGVWKQFGKPEEGASILIGYARDKAFTRKVGKLTNEAHQQTKGRRLEQDVIRNLNRRAMVGTLMKDFKGFCTTDENGNDVELPREPKEKLNQSILLLLTNEIVYEFVQEQASDLSNFQKEGDPIAEPDAEAKAESKSSPPAHTEESAGQS